MALHPNAWKGQNIVILDESSFLATQLEQALAHASPANEVKIESFHKYEDVYEFCKENGNVGFTFVSPRISVPIVEILNQLGKFYNFNGTTMRGVVVYDDKDNELDVYRTRIKEPKIFRTINRSEIVNTQLTPFLFNELWQNYMESIETEHFSKSLQNTLYRFASEFKSEESLTFMERLSIVLSENLNISWFDFIALKWAGVLNVVNEHQSVLLEGSEFVANLSNHSKAIKTNNILDVIQNKNTTLTARVSTLLVAIDDARINGELNSFLQNFKTISKPGSPALIRSISKKSDFILDLSEQVSLIKFSKKGCRMSLSIVPFNSNDYSLIRTIISEDIESIESVSHVFSLYFQFKSESRVYLNNKGEKIFLDLSYDEDEASPTEIFSKYENDELSNLLRFSKEAEIYIEIFQTLFCFSVQIIDANITEKYFIFNPPLKSFKLSRRRFPRIEFQNEFYDKIQVSLNNIKTKVYSIGINSIELDLTDGSNISSLIINGMNIKFEKLREQNNQTVLGYKFENEEEYGRYFDIYRLIAYPTLRSRYDYSYEDGLKLFEQTGYLGKYTSENRNENLLKMHKTFDPVKQDVHKNVVDYYAIDNSGQLKGSSGLALSQIDENNIPYWCMQHMCAVKDTNDLDNSGALYTWRAEYMAGRAEDLIMIVKFSADSKWIQRIFHKFHTYAGAQSGVLIDTKSSILKLQLDKKETTATNLKYHKVNIGNETRKMGATAGFLMGHGPINLNFAGLLEEVIALSDISIDQFLELTNEYLNQFNIEELSIKMVCPHDSQLANMPGEHSPSNGLCYIRKKYLFDFIKSIQHSIAVTKKKLKDAA